MAKTLVKDAYHFNELLKEKYGERIVTDPIEVLRGKVCGRLDSKVIIISFIGDKCLLISTDSKSRDILDELKPVLTEVMGNEEPICSYDLQSEGLEEKDSLPTMEWDIVAPEDRIKEIVNGRAYSDDAKIHNLKLTNSKNPDDYLESEEEKEERIKNARIYGIDPGNIKDVEAINNLSEVDLYFHINALGGHIWRCNHEMFHHRMPIVDLTEENYALEYMVYQTKKFGVELDEPAIDKHITPTPSYNAWFRFYNHHFQDVLTEEQWEAYQQAQENGQDTSEFMPSGHWSDLLKEETKKEEVKKEIKQN